MTASAKSRVPKLVSCTQIIVIWASLICSGPGLYRRILEYVNYSSEKAWLKCVSLLTKYDRHDMETLYVLLTLCEGNPSVTGAPPPTPPPPPPPTPTPTPTPTPHPHPHPHPHPQPPHAPRRDRYIELLVWFLLLSVWRSCWTNSQVKTQWNSCDATVMNRLQSPPLFFDEASHHSGHSSWSKVLWKWSDENICTHKGKHFGLNLVMLIECW